MRFKETERRSIVKSATFRVIVVISDLVIIYVLTKRVVATIAITIVTNMASTTLYFLHERAWNRISWGKKTR